MITTPSTRMFVTGRRYVTPDAPGILGDDPRWLTAKFEEVIAVTDLETLVPSHWKQTSGPTVPRPAASYEGPLMWENLELTKPQ